MAPKLYKQFTDDRDYVLANGPCLKQLKGLKDSSVALTITSPPYFMGKEYDYSDKIDDFIKDQTSVLKEIVRVTEDGGSICWQIGYHVKDNTVIPLDFYIYQIMRSFESVTLRNRLIWTFGHGLHSSMRFSGRHETILWFTKGGSYHFDLDKVRVPQKYPGKKSYKGNKKGEYSGNPLGKNPSDVWEIPNVNANHVEKTDHPCQFPVALADRLVRALGRRNSLVLDPYMGSGTTGVAAIMNECRFFGCELDRTYYEIAFNRCNDALNNRLRFRSDKPVFIPSLKHSVARKPLHFN